MLRHTRSSLRLRLFIVALVLALPGQPVHPAAPAAADFTFDKRVMLRSAYDARRPCAGASDLLAVPYGAAVVYCFEFTNTGTTTFTLHTLEDDQLSGFFEYAQDVAPGGRIIVPALPPDPITADVTNTATWYATDTAGATLARTDSAVVRVLAQRTFLPLLFR
jgi:hypothetical protein